MANSMFKVQAAGYWPLSSILAVMGRAYDNVSHIEDDNNQRYYEVELKGLKFLAILVHAEGAPEKIQHFGFMGYFAGFDLSINGAEALNRNLHISVAELDDNQNLILFSFLEAQGAFDESHFSMILEAWHRDIVMTLKMITPGASFGTALSARALDIVRVHGVNALPRPKLEQTGPQNMEPKVGFSAKTGLLKGDAADLPCQSLPMYPENVLRKFLGARDASRSLCGDCGGQGKRGLVGSFLVRSCKSCEGSGLSAPS